MSDAIIKIIGFFLLFTGSIVCIYWQIRLLVAAFKCSLWWFFGCLFVPFADLAFVLFNFEVARKPFGLSLLGLIMTGLGGCMAGIVWSS